LGTPTILVNNSGTGGPGKPVSATSDEEWNNVLRTNLYGPFCCCREFIRGIEGSSRHGTIINIRTMLKTLFKQ
jgi:glucose 1-dehydrogenase